MLILYNLNKIESNMNYIFLLFIYITYLSTIFNMLSIIQYILYLLYSNLCYAYLWKVRLTMQEVIIPALFPEFLIWIYHYLFIVGYFILLIATVKSDVREILNKERDSGNVARPSKLFQPPRYQDINLNKPVPDDLSLNTAVDIGIVKNQQKKITSDTTNNNQRFNQLVSLNRWENYFN